MDSNQPGHRRDIKRGVIRSEGYPQGESMRVFGWSSGRGGVHWYRIREPLRGLKLRGHTTQQSHILFGGESLNDYDVLLAHGVADPKNSHGWQRLAEIGRHQLIYDIDDDHWNWHPDTEQYQFWTEDRLMQVEENIIVADIVTTPSRTFASHLSQLNRNVIVRPNTIPEWLTKIHLPRGNRPFVVGWEGAPHHIDDLTLVYAPLFRFMIHHPDVQLWLWGPWKDPHADYMPGMEGRVQRFPWQKSVADYYRSLDMDVCLAPLQPTAFNETKSAIRVQEHSALGIPVIASPSPAYSEYLFDGQNGFYADREDEWEDHLEYLYRNHDARGKLGRQGRNMAKVWTTEANSIYWESLLGQGNAVKGSVTVG